MPQLLSHPNTSYTGRFAPSPTGPLHFGSLLAALASFLDARAHGGQWLVRIEDIDPPREMSGATQSILECLRAHGLEWDGDVLYQSSRLSTYRDICSQLIEEQRAFYCTCSRLDLANNGGIYSGRCRRCFEKPSQPFAIRLIAEAIDIRVEDRIQPAFTENIARDIGDFVIFRKEDLPAYQLAVVADDAAQRITHIVRGSDLLESTARQIFLQQCLRLPTPSYAHIPVIANAQHQKLSKQTHAQALDPSNAPKNLLAALDFLEQPLPPASERQSVSRILQWAITYWDIARISRRPERAGDDIPPSCQHFAR
jgi:glutamyl-Q tRNA(Asp) synthetase